MVFHEEEKRTIWKLMDDKGEAFSPITMTFAEGDKYICRFVTDSEADNGLEPDSPNYDEYWEMIYVVTKVIKVGPNSAEGVIDNKGTVERDIVINYKHFPVFVTTEDGEVLYDARG